jgi:hypothetical protein
MTSPERNPADKPQGEYLASKNFGSPGQRLKMLDRVASILPEGLSYIIDLTNTYTNTVEDVFTRATIIHADPGSGEIWIPLIKAPAGVQDYKGTKDLLNARGGLIIDILGVGPPNLASGPIGQSASTIITTNTRIDRADFEIVGVVPDINQAVIADQTKIKNIENLDTCHALVLYRPVPNVPSET